MENTVTVKINWAEIEHCDIRVWLMFFTFVGSANMKVENWILFLWLTHRNHFRWFRVHCKKCGTHGSPYLKMLYSWTTMHYCNFTATSGLDSKCKNTVNVEEKNKQERRQSENMFPDSLRANHQELLNQGPRSLKKQWSCWKSWRMTIQTSTNSIYSSIKTRESETQVNRPAPGIRLSHPN